MLAKPFGLKSCKTNSVSLRTLKHSRPSPTWRGTTKGHCLIRENTKIVINNGSTNSFWYNLWLDNGSPRSLLLALSPPPNPNSLWKFVGTSLRISVPSSLVFQRTLSEPPIRESARARDGTPRIVVGCGWAEDILKKHGHVQHVHSY